MRVPPIPRIPRLAVFALAGLLTGCGDDNPTKPKPPPPIVYPVLSSPQSVLVALEISYSNRDSTEYMRLFDPDYLGQSYDPDKDSTSTFRWADEQRHIQSLASVTTIVGHILCDFGPEASWTRLPSDDLAHPERAAIQVPGSALTILIDDGIYTLAVHGPGESMTWQFSPTSPDSSSPTDTLWKIVRWDENL